MAIVILPFMDRLYDLHFAISALTFAVHFLKLEFKLASLLSMSNPKIVEEIGREVMEGKLYRQFVLHLVQLGKEAVLSKGEVVRLVSKMQNVG